MSQLVPFVQLVQLAEQGKHVLLLRKKLMLQEVHVVLVDRQVKQLESQGKATATPD